MTQAATLSNSVTLNYALTMTQARNKRQIIENSAAFGSEVVVRPAFASSNSTEGCHFH
jgi:hypothetical protein